MEIQTSVAPASKYRARFSSISDVVFEGEKDFGPPNEVKLSLRLEVWKFDGDGHDGRYARK